MKLVKKNPEASLNKFLTTIGPDRTGWYGFVFEPANNISHEKMITPVHHINGKLHKLNKQAEALAEALAKKSPPMTEGTIFVMPGGIVVVVARADLYTAFSEMCDKSDVEIQRLIDLDANKVAEVLAPGQDRMAVYEAIADTDRVKSIEFRRNRHRNGTVLVVDNDHFTGTYVSTLLKNDYDVIVVRNGREAIENYVKYAPHVVLLDIHMPDMDGHEILSTLRAIDPSTAAVIVTGDADDDQIFAAAREGAIAFLRKPLAKEKLLKTIREAPGMKKYGSTGK
jgi:CheY-like chemotaxis protein